MPILTIQRRLRETGRLRLGEQVVGRNGKTAPAKLHAWRFTSAERHALDVAAEHYGGTVRRWKDAPTAAEQFELYGKARTIDVIVPPDELALSQWFEHWSGGGCLRRCDGEMEQLALRPCVCASEDGPRLCKATTRLSVILADVPGLGTWRLETHSYYAATEIPGAFELLSMAYARGGRLLPAKLTITERERKVPGEATHQFIVPALDVPLTVYELAASTGLGIGALPATGPHLEIETSPGGPGQALPRAPEPEPEPEPTMAPLERPEDVFKSDPGIPPAKDPIKRRTRRTADLPPVDFDAPPPPPPVEEPTAPPLAAVPPPEPHYEPSGGYITNPQRGKLMALAMEVGLNDRQERLSVFTGILKRPLTTSSDLPSSDASILIDALQDVADGRRDFALDDDCKPVGVKVASTTGKPTLVVDTQGRT